MKPPLPFVIAGITALTLFISFRGFAKDRYCRATAAEKATVDTNRPASLVKPSLAFKFQIRQLEVKKANFSYATVYERAEEMKELAATRGSNTDYAILVDLNLASGEKRCFVVDLASMTIINYGLIATDGDTQPSAAQGIYAIGKQLTPTSYALESLQKAKHNKQTAAMALQSSDAIPDKDIIFPLPSMSDGLGISPEFFGHISKMLNKADKPFLLWVYP